MKRRLGRSLCTALLLVLPGRAAEERPTVGVVLGGGGALGFAHIGTLQRLEELQIPIDYIGGTSMGAIVAGMYASGMSPGDIEAAFLELDWWDVLRDRSPHPYLTYRRKVEDKRFYGLEFGLREWKPIFSPGMAYGQKLNNVLGTFALDSVGIEDFDQLNIPYRAVATDLYSGKAVVLKSGPLARAMRASMAVPAVFTPVRIGEQVLVDGGIVNNIPVDVVKEMGADIIIAVDVGAASADKGIATDFSALGDVIARAYSIMQRPEQERQLKMADVVIEPDLAGFSAADFHKVRAIIPCGRKAAEQMSRQLSAYSNPDAFKEFLQRQRNGTSDPIRITGIRVESSSAASTRAARIRVRAEEGPLNLKVVDDDLKRIHGTGLFQTVHYLLEPTTEGYDLVYSAQEKFWGPNYLHVGTKLESSSKSDVLWSLLLNHTRTQLNPLDGELAFNLELGGHIRFFNAEWYQPVTPGGLLFVAPSVRLLWEEFNLYIEDEAVAEIEKQQAFGRFDAGISLFEFGELRAGMLAGHAVGSGKSGIIDLGRESDTVVAATARFRLDQLDDPVFPKRGYQLSADALFADKQMGSSQTFQRVEARVMIPFTIGRHTFTPRAAGGSSLGSELPFYAVFDLGGIDELAGYAPYQLLGNYYGVLSLGHRYRIGRLPPTLGSGIYTLIRGDIGDAWADQDTHDWQEARPGLFVGLGADTIAGILKVGVGKAESLNARFYFSIGTAF